MESFLCSLAREVKPRGKDVTYYRREVACLLGEGEKILTKKRNIKANMRKLSEKLTQLIGEQTQKEEEIRKKEIKLEKALRAAEAEGEEPDEEPMQ